MRCARANSAGIVLNVRIVRAKETFARSSSNHDMIVGFDGTRRNVRGGIVRAFVAGEKNAEYPLEDLTQVSSSPRWLGWISS